MNETEKQFVVVTGASTGIGYACVEALLASGRFVFGVVRKKDDARRLKSDLGDDFAPLLFDVTDEDAIRRAVSVVEQRLAGGLSKALLTTPASPCRARCCTSQLTSFGSSSRSM